MRNILLSFASLAVVTAATAVGCSVEPIDLSDDDDFTTTSSTTSGSGGTGAGTTTGSGAYGGGCEGLCDKVDDASCANEDSASCLSECEGLYGQAPAGCAGDLDALIACQIANGTVMCEDGDAKVTGCDAEQAAFVMCLTSGAGGGGAGGGGGGGAGDCYANFGTCNPLTDSCGAGAACDIGQDGLFTCFPPPNDVPIGGTCNAQSGPYCQHGGACVGTTCAAFCCSDADCNGGTCQEVGTGTGFTVKACG